MLSHVDSGLDGKMHRRPASPTVTLAASGPGSRPPTPVGQRRRGSMDSATLLEANDSFHLHQREASALLEQLRSAIAGESLFARRASDATSQPERKKSVSPTISGRNGSQPVSVPVQLSAPSKQAPVLPSLSQPSLAFPHPSPPSQPQSIHRGGTPPYPYPAPAPPVHASTVNRRIAKPHHVMSVPSPDVPSLRSDTPASHPYDSESPSVYATASVANRVKALPGVLSASQTCSLLTARLHQRSSPNPGRAFIAFSGPIAVPRPPVAAPAPVVSRPSPPVFSVDSHRVLFTSVSPSSSSSTQSLSYAAIHRSQGSTPSRVSTQTQTDAPTVSTGTQSESTGVTERNGRSGRRPSTDSFSTIAEDQSILREVEWKLDMFSTPVRRGGHNCSRPSSPEREEAYGKHDSFILTQATGRQAQSSDDSLLLDVQSVVQRSAKLRERLDDSLQYVRVTRAQRSEILTPSRMKSSVGGSGILSIERIEGDAPDATPSSLTDLAHAPGYVTPGLSGRWDSKFVGVDLRDARVADDVGAIFRATGAPYALDVYRTGDGGNKSHGQSRHDHNTRSIHGDTHSYRGVRVVPSDSGLAPHTHVGTFGRTVAPYRHHLDSRGDNTTPK